jgi:hypothetical protein
MLRIRLLPVLLAATTALLTTACEPAPDYPDEPSIEFKEITGERVNPTDGNTAYNLVYVAIKYKDGDGDLGLSDADLQTPPFTPGNRYNKNFFVNMFRYNSAGQWQQVIPSIPFDATFARLLSEDQKPQPIRGDLKLAISKDFGFTVTTPDYRPGTRIRFTVQIVDRALHESNVITTDEYVLK